MSERLDRFVNLMKSIFELDKSDLDFGIYRIINIRKSEIEKFLTEGLKSKVDEILAPFVNNTQEIIKRISEIEAQCEAVGVDVVNSKMANEYLNLKNKLVTGIDKSDLETDVYSALYSFFNRYYDDGDFISKRRYKEGVYAIPYEGEEVKLYWANEDQYYIKTSENFTDYSFVARNKYGNECNVHFLLVDATMEQNNNKETEDSKRTFMLYEESDERPDIKTFEYRKDSNEFIVRFVFDIPQNKKIKYLQDNSNKIRAKIAESFPELIDILLVNVSNDSKKPKTLLDKHLEAYVAKNTFDYFIHKDLKSFLYRELDFYIKNEIMNLDDLDTVNEKKVESYLAKVRAIKRIGHIIIDFLAQIENFQKKLWLKKKFIITTNWCITLDKINISFWEEIIKNDRQVQEWLDLYAVDEIDGWTNPPTIEFLKENQNLIVDTNNFTTEFRDRLIASIDNLDEETDGLMINGDNFHVLRILQNKYENKIDCVYIDPPYNTNSLPIMYKNNYKDSSWMSLIYDRNVLTKDITSNTCVYINAIDEVEYQNLIHVNNVVYGKRNYIGTIITKCNPQGRVANKINQTSEYNIMFAKDIDSISKLTVKKLDKKSNKTPLKRTGTNSRREQRPKRYYPILIKNNKVSMIDKNEYRNIYDEKEKRFNDDYVISLKNKYNALGYDVILPKMDDGTLLVWQREFDRVFKECSTYIVEDNVIYTPAYEREIPKSFWESSKFANPEYGTELVKNMFNERLGLDVSKNTPKSIYTVEQFIDVNNSNIILDFFAGSGTTAHAVIDLNYNDMKQRKYILAEMGEYFNEITLNRVKKCIYSPTIKNWENGKPLKRDDRVSHICKYFSMESYEDALSNIQLSDNNMFNLFGEDYLINYMLDVESKGSILNLEQFKTPFNYKLKINQNNETKRVIVDLIETFNYLLGIQVKKQSVVDIYDIEKNNSTAQGIVSLISNKSGDFAFKRIDGILNDGSKVLIIWRTLSDNLIESNAALDAYYTMNICDKYDIIYVNGDNNLLSLDSVSSKSKVKLIETEFKNLMFEGI